MLTKIDNHTYKIGKGKKKYFVVTDLHNHFKIFNQRLINSGFNKNNPNHFLIILGDAFDKGPEANEMYNYLLSIEGKLTYIKGNHEEVLLKAIKEKKINDYLIEHSVFDTIYQLSGLSLKEALNNFKKACEKVEEKGFVDFLKRKLIDYYELDDFFFAHGYLAKDGNYDKARWLCGYKYFREENEKINKISIFGHMRHDIYKEVDDYEPIFLINKNNDKAICLDAYTAISKMMNILIIEK